jgi:hypothetical protein
MTTPYLWIAIVLWGPTSDRLQAKDPQPAPVVVTQIIPWGSKDWKNGLYIRLSPTGRMSNFRGTKIEVQDLSLFVKKCAASDTGGENLIHVVVPDQSVTIETLQIALGRIEKALEKGKSYTLYIHLLAKDR